MVSALQSAVIILQALNLSLVLCILLLKHPVLRDDTRPLLNLLVQPATLARLLLQHLRQLASLFVGTNHVTLKFLDGELELHVGVLELVVVSATVVELEDDGLHLGHVLNQTLLDVLVNVFAMRQRLQGLS